MNYEGNVALDQPQGWGTGLRKVASALVGYRVEVMAQRQESTDPRSPSKSEAGPQARTLDLPSTLLALCP